MIERNFYGGPINVHCDTCPEGVETGRREFAEALAIIKEDGWKVRRIADEWVHFCPDCDVPA